MQNGKKVAVGEPIEGYYPQIIDEKTFYSIQELLVSDFKKGGRRQPEYGRKIVELISSAALRVRAKKTSHFWRSDLG